MAAVERSLFKRSQTFTPFPHHSGSHRCAETYVKQVQQLCHGMSQTCMLCMHVDMMPYTDMLTRLTICLPIVQTNFALVVGTQQRRSLGFAEFGARSRGLSASGGITFLGGAFWQQFRDALGLRAWLSAHSFAWSWP